MRKKILLILVLTCLLWQTKVFADNLYNMFKKYPEIKVFLKDIINETDHPDVKTDVFRKVFKDVLKARINIKFVPVDSEKHADVVITGRMKKYVFKSRVMPRFTGMWTLVADVTAPKSCGKISVDYEIRNPKDGKLLLAFKNFTTEERKPVEDTTEESCYIDTIKKNINRFLYRAFYKQRQQNK